MSPIRHLLTRVQSVPTLFVTVIGIALLASGCSVRRLAASHLANALAGRGTTFASDDDPQLIREALPFSLKLMEGLLAETPNHSALLLACSSGFTQYAYAFVQLDADELEATNFTAAEALRTRARRIYLRARDYGIRGLEVDHPGFRSGLDTKPREAVRVATRDDVPLLYWTAASWAAAIALAKDDPLLVGQLPQMEALIDRALELDEAWDAGSIHSFLISYEMARSGAAGAPEERARRHFDRAVELSGGRLAGPYVSLAEAVSVEKQDTAQFREILQKALAIDADAQPETRLFNLVMQRRARWLLSQEEDLFLQPATSGTH